VAIENPDSTEVVQAPARRVFGERAFWVGFWVLALGLVGLNLWWTWEERPLPNLQAIGLWMARGWYDEAEWALRAHLKRSPNDGEARWMLARALAARNNMAGCLEQVRQIPFWWSRKPEALFREGQAAMVLGRASEAEEAWKQCVLDDPQHPTPAKYFTQAVNELVQLYKWEDRRDEARELLWRALSLTEPADHPTILLMSVWICLLKNDPAEAAAKLARFVAAEPRDYVARRALARATLDLGKTAEARAHIEACLAARPADPLVWRDYLYVLVRLGDRLPLDQALARLPNDANQFPEAWIARGFERQQERDLPAAALAYREAVRLKPFEEDAYYKLALVEKRLGHKLEADQALDRYNTMHSAREELRNLYEGYLGASRGPTANPGALPELGRRLAACCETLGWTREAKAWRQVAAAS
jgi:enediyne biosynthesis protein E4